MDVSFVIVEYRSHGEIAVCQEALARHAAGFAHETIVSSNSLYARQEREKLAGDHPRVRWLFNEKNGGFAYASNRGIEAAAGDVIVLLNSDARLRSDLGPALDFLHARPEVAVLGPRMIDPRGDLQDSARPFMTPVRLLARSLARALGGRRPLLEKGFDYDAVQPVDWVIGAFMVVKRSAIAKTGRLDEGYFMYVEDMDWCRRFWDSGFQVYFFPGLRVEFSGTRRSTAFLHGGGIPGRLAWSHSRSYLRFLRKHRYYFRRGRSSQE